MHGPRASPQPPSPTRGSKEPRPPVPLRGGRLFRLRSSLQPQVRRCGQCAIATALCRAGYGASAERTVVTPSGIRFPVPVPTPNCAGTRRTRHFRYIAVAQASCRCPVDAAIARLGARIVSRRGLAMSDLITRSARKDECLSKRVGRSDWLRNGHVRRGRQAR